MSCASASAAACSGAAGAAAAARHAPHTVSSAAAMARNMGAVMVSLRRSVRGELPQVAVEELVRLVEGGDVDPLVAAVLTVVVRIDAEGRERVGGQSRGTGVGGI